MQFPSAAVRTMLLAVQVMDDVELTISDSGVVLPGCPNTYVGWGALTEAVGTAVPGSRRGRSELVRWLTQRRQLAALSKADLRAAIRPAGLPVGHAEHPGDDWVCETVLGGVLDLGIGLLGLDPQYPDRVDLVQASVWRAARVRPETWWPAARARLESMGTLAAHRWQNSPDGVLRPMGDCDVVTLLGSATLRAALAGTEGGMCPVVVPMRDRGWTSLSRLDPAFGPAAAMATLPAARGFSRPLLVTADEVVLARDGRHTTVSMRDPVREDAGEKAFLFR